MGIFQYLKPTHSFDIFPFRAPTLFTKDIVSNCIGGNDATFSYIKLLPMLQAISLVIKAMLELAFKPPLNFGKHVFGSFHASMRQ